MTTWLMQWDAHRSTTLAQAIDTAKKHSGKVCGMELHPDYPSRAVVMVRFSDYWQAERFGQVNSILNDIPIREDRA